MARFVNYRVLVAAAGFLLAGSALAESTAPVQPNFFPDVQAQEAAWTLSVGDTKPDGLSYNTRLRLHPRGKAPVTKWLVEIECERANVQTHKYNLHDDAGAAVLVGGAMVMTFKGGGLARMLTKEPMTLTVDNVSPLCAGGSPWISLADD